MKIQSITPYSIKERLFFILNFEYEFEIDGGLFILEKGKEMVMGLDGF
jgi:hypothetical protein